MRKIAQAWLSTRRRRDAGYADTVITLVGTTLLLITILQVTLYVLAVNLAQMGTTSGYEAGRSYQSTAAEGKHAAEQMLARGAGYLNNARVVVTRTESDITVTVVGQSPSILPGVELPDIEKSVSGPVERWVE